ncbi:MAG TPA: polyribonucleotide nucleotidyltransferase [Vicinamibacteria bacterium]|nr:polyribonucleotide nucleotidyltransferase [Vicinamibacteria bacterium]
MSRSKEGMMHRKEVQIGERVLTIEMGKLAKQANGAALVRMGDTVVLMTACASKEVREGIDFLPLTVDYRENFYASGKIPGGFFKREGRPNEKEILTSRLIDRPIRPLFPDGWHRETQVIGLVLSTDKANDSDVLAVTGASAALYCSDIPFLTPIGAVRVGLVDGAFVINPTFEQLKVSDLNLTVAGSREAIVMVEAGANEVPEAQMVDALALAHEEIKKLTAMQEELFQALSPTKIGVVPHARNEELENEVEQKFLTELAEAMRTKGKLDSQRAVDQVHSNLREQMGEREPEVTAEAEAALKRLSEKVLRDEVLDKGRRLDGRDFDAVREVTCEVGVLPRTHGSSLFTRGETQALVTVTLGTSDDVQILDWLEGESEKRFMLHYNFPPFSVGEARFLRGPGRREIGHGALAERALVPVIPGENEFPYTIRIVSDILESNGSSSMASVTGGCLALMDAGVPLKAPIAGIAMGLIKENEKYAILTDIAGAEDHYGDMDFKVAGTANGITALQMDIKIEGLTREIMSEALEQARRARMFILEKMAGALPAPRREISAYAPRIFTMRIPTDKIRDVIGPGGKMIRSIIERTGVKIDVEDDGSVAIASLDEASARKAIQIIEELTAVPEIGKTYLGKVQRIVDFGAFVEIIPGTDGLLHISEVADYRVKDVRSELSEGDQILVKVINIDPQGKVKLSRKAVLREQAGLPPEEPQMPRSDGGRREEEGSRREDGGHRRRRSGGRRR